MTVLKTGRNVGALGLRRGELLSRGCEGEGS